MSKNCSVLGRIQWTQQTWGNRWVWKGTKVKKLLFKVIFVASLTVIGNCIFLSLGHFLFWFYNSFLCIHKHCKCSDHCNSRWAGIYLSFFLSFFLLGKIDIFFLNQYWWNSNGHILILICLPFTFCYKEWQILQKYFEKYKYLKFIIILLDPHGKNIGQNVMQQINSGGVCLYLPWVRDGKEQNRTKKWNIVLWGCSCTYKADGWQEECISGCGLTVIWSWSAPILLLKEVLPLSAVIVQGMFPSICAGS